MLAIRGTANSFHAVFDGHGPFGHVIAEHAKLFFSSDRFKDGLLTATTKPNHLKEAAYTSLFIAEINKLEKSFENEKFKSVIGGSGK